MSETSPKIDLYKTVTDRIITAIESGQVAPWHRPWIAEGLAPRNAITGKLYRGVNLWVLGSLPYADPRYLTFNQARSLGGRVRKGEHGSPVVFWKFFDSPLREDDEEQKPIRNRRIPLLKHFTVFNVAQVDGLNLKPWESAAPLNPGRKIEAAEALIAGMPQCPAIRYGFAHAAYSPMLDRVEMPEMGRFESEDAYYSTMFHELVHATGHGSRLGREGIVNPSGFGSDRYSEEELVAEMGAAFLCACCGIDSRADQSAAYLNGWLSRFRQDTRLLVKAAGKAQRAADWVRGMRAEGNGEEGGDTPAIDEEYSGPDNLAACSVTACG